MRDLSCHDEWSDALSKQVRLAVTTNNGIEWQRDNLKFSVIRSPMRLWQSPGAASYHGLSRRGGVALPCIIAQGDAERRPMASRFETRCSESAQL